MAGSLSPPARTSTIPPPVEGSFLGSGLVGGVQHFLKTYGNVAAHSVIARLSPSARLWVKPNADNFGILGAKKYPYAFVGELVRAMAAAVRKNEDEYCREFAQKGVDFTLETVNRVVLRYMISPQSLTERAQELWNMYHSSGRIQTEWVNKSEYLVFIHEWRDHDVTVCKVCMEARRHIVALTRVHDLEVRREKCQAWGHDVCCNRVRWRG